MWSGLVSENFRECPTFEFGDRLGFDDADAVADGGLALFVVHVVFLGALDDLVEFRVRNAGNVFDDDGFFHFVGNNDTYAGFAFVNGSCGFLG